MAEGLKIRDLFVSLGFDVDDTALRRVDKNLVSVRNNVRRLSIFMAAGSVAIGAFIKEDDAASGGAVGKARAIKIRRPT